MCTGPLSTVRGPLPTGEVDTNSAILATEHKGMTCVRNATSSRTIDGLYGPVTVQYRGSVTVYTNAGTISVFMPDKIINPECHPQVVNIPPPPYPANPPIWVNTCRGCIGYDGLITDNHLANQTGTGPLRSISFDFEVASCGDYNLVASYASPSHRPVNIIVDGLLETSEGLSGDTPADWSHAKDGPSPELVLPLRAGTHKITLERTDSFPHVGSLRLLPY